MLGVAIGVFACIGAALAYGALRWLLGTRTLRRAIDGARVPHANARVALATLDTLPAPVRRYFRAALTDGQPVVAAATIDHRGTFDIGTTAPQWRRFTSTERVVTSRRGFDWDARIAVVPGISLHVHDAYAGGEGVLQASLLGLVPVAHLRGGADIARGELMRFVAEAAWYPTALLPGEGVRWEGVDERSARAIVRDGDIEVSLLFAFGDDGLVDRVTAESRARTVGRTIVPTPWRGRFWNVGVRDGMRIPMSAEVSWLLPEGARPYWRGAIAAIRYEFEPRAAR